MQDNPEYDVIVVGSGAAGMSAALTAAHNGLSVVIVEKAAYYGGSTARSGGGVWIPNNRALQADGVEDTPQAARDYLHAIIGDVVPAERIDAYLAEGPKALEFLLDKTPLKMQWVPGYSDYYPEAPGGRVGGRSVEPKPFNLKKLGPEARNLEPDYVRSPRNFVITQADYKQLNMIKRLRAGKIRAFKVGLRWIIGMLLGKRLAVRGQALSAALRGGLLQANVPVLLNTPLADIITENGRVTGVVVVQNNEQRILRARHGVVLACGGFEHNLEMRQKYQRAPITTDWTVGAKANTGDGILAGLKLGADVDLMDDAWWGPSIPMPRKPWFCLAERTLPGNIIVNDRAQRFMNEALPYVEAVHRMYGGDFGQGDGPAENIPAWMIIDQRYRNRYPFAGVVPGQPLPKKWFESGVVTKAETIEQLAQKIGLDPAALAATVSRFNGFARTGKDEDFGRGDSGYDKYYSDPTVTPNPSLGAVENAPFYAIKLVPGDLGTKGGLVTDVAGRVLRPDGSVIDGLYAAGNVSSPVMGHTYAGPGATIGPALTFGYLAALDIATKAIQPGSSRSAH